MTTGSAPHLLDGPPRVPLVRRRDADPVPRRREPAPRTAPVPRRRHVPDGIRAPRLAAGLSKAGLGRAVGRSGQAVAGWEDGRTRPGEVTRRRLESVFGLAVGVLTDQGPEAGSTIERG